eukprot:1486469-Prorocentrum_lima.AAC.1
MPPVAHAYKQFKYKLMALWYVCSRGASSMSWRKITGPCRSHIGLLVLRWSMRTSCGRRLYECAARLLIQYLQGKR